MYVLKYITNLKTFKTVIMSQIEEINFLIY